MLKIDLIGILFLLLNLAVYGGIGYFIYYIFRKKNQ